MLRRERWPPLWDAPIEPGPLILKTSAAAMARRRHARTASRVYAVFGSAVIAALDFDGKPVWRKTLTNIAFDVALGSSPILFRDTVILDCDQTGKTSSIIAFDKATGDIRWEAKRPDTSFAHSTPVIVEVAGKPQMLVSASGAIQGLDPDKRNDLVVVRRGGRCVVAGLWRSGLVFSDSGRGGKAVCVDPSGAGDVTKTHLKWTFPQIPEGLVFGDHRRESCVADAQSRDLEMPKAREWLARLRRASARRLHLGQPFRNVGWANLFRQCGKELCVEGRRQSGSPRDQ